MGQFNSKKTNFTGGEISPRLYGRTDLKTYENSCASMKNMYIHPHGGAARRSGFKFIAEAGNSSLNVRIIPFEFSVEQTYILEFGNYYVRIFMDEGLVLNESLEPYEIMSPYAADELEDLQFCQSADMLYLCHKNHPPVKLGRSGHADWAFYDFDMAYGPWALQPLADFDTEITPSAATGLSITLTASADLFQAEDAGRFIRLDQGGTYGAALITSVTDPQTAVADVVRDFADTTATSYWQMHEFSDNRGYPTAVTFHQQRLAMAGTKTNPQTVWLSRTDVYEDFEISDPLQDDDACSFTLASGEINSVRWLTSIKTLAVGTAGGEWVISGASDSAPITPSGVSAVRYTSFGSANARPASLGSEMAYLQRGGKKLRVFGYDIQSDGYKSSDMLILSEHFTNGHSIKSFAFRKNPDPIMWAVRTDGLLLGMTYLSEHNVISWHKHETQGEFESIAIIPDDVSGDDELWAVIKREINGETKRYIELMDKNFNAETAADGYFVDSGLKYEGDPVDTLSGRDHLEGEEVQITADGAVHPSRIVENGSITLNKEASKVTAGLGYVSEIETLNIEGGADMGTSQGMKKRTYKAIVRLYKTLGLKIGSDFDNLDEIYFRDSSMPMSEAPALFTGDKSMLLKAKWETAGRVCIRQEQPLPMTVLSIVQSLDTNAT